MPHQEYIRICPGSDTAFLFIHGINGTPDHFRDLIALLPQSVSVYNLLLDGHGKSTADFAHSSMRAWQEQTDNVVTMLSEKHKHIIITAHSMGALLAMRACERHPESISALFLLAAPLVIHIKPSALINSLKVTMERVSEANVIAAAMRDGCSIALSKNPFCYIGWIPRYLELFREAKAIRKIAPAIDIPCRVLLSAHDEMVSLRSGSYLTGCKTRLKILPDSRHYYYAPGDRAQLLKEFSGFCEEYIK